MENMKEKTSIIHRMFVYKWIVLSNTTLGVLMAALDSSIVLISLPAIFRGIKINPLVPSETGYLLWVLMGYMVVTAVLLVTFGRISDMFGRVKLYNLGFAIFTVGSILLSLTWGTGNSAALEIIIFRFIQGIGGAFLFTNSFFPTILAKPFMDGVIIAFSISAGISLLAALASLLRGKQYIHEERFGEELE